MEHRVLNHNLECGWIEWFDYEPKFKWVRVGIEGSIYKTLAGSNQHKVKVEDQSGDKYVFILDYKEAPIKVHKSCLQQVLDKTGYKKTLMAERDRLCKAWQHAKQNDSSEQHELWDAYSELLKRI